MVTTTSKKKTLKENINQGKESEINTSEYQGKPVYLFRNMISDISRMGSDLLIESI